MTTEPQVGSWRGGPGRCWKDMENQDLPGIATQRITTMVSCFSPGWGQTVRQH